MPGTLWFAFGTLAWVPGILDRHLSLGARHLVDRHLGLVGGTDEEGTWVGDFEERTIVVLQAAHRSNIRSPNQHDSHLPEFLLMVRLGNRITGKPHRETALTIYLRSNCGLK